MSAPMTDATKNMVILLENIGTWSKYININHKGHAGMSTLITTSSKLLQPE